MKDNRKKTLSVFCVLMAAALTLTACAPGAASNLTQEEDLALAWELERSFLGLDTDGLANNADYPEDMAASLMAAKSLAIPGVFKITRPTKKLTTTYASYFITGTSDPDSPVYFGGDAIQRQGTKGTFGAHVSLAMGTNTFTFSQNGVSETVTITRNAPAGTAAIKDIQQDSMVPAIMSGVKEGQQLSVGCVAPSGATIEASYGGKAVTLKQTNSDIKSGMPATFTGKLTIDGDYDSGITQKGGKVAYTMSYNGVKQKYVSTGHVYVAGEDSDVAIEVISYLGFIYPNYENLSHFKETVRTGARDYVSGETNKYFKLDSGGYIPKEQVKVVTGTVKVRNKLSEAGFSSGSKSERFIFKGSRSPLYDTWIADDVLYLRMYNTTGTPSVSASGSKLVSSCRLTEGDDGSVTAKLPLKGLVWGFDVAFDGGDTVLLLKYKPGLSSGQTPLKGVTILLDPGHGGEDPGALGVAGTTGPTEAEVNLAGAFAARDELERMGAKVIMSRSGDKRVSLDERLQMIEDNKVDMFISMHHNSIIESADANKASGMEIYYHTAQSKKFANTMMASLDSGLDRKNRSVNQSYYRVTLMHYAPALLLELGFMSNPLEYEKAATGSEMEKVARAIADGVVNTLK